MTLKHKRVISILLFLQLSVLLTGCAPISFNSNGKSIISSDERKTSSDQLLLDEVTSAKMEVSIDMGSIKVEYNDDEEVRIEVDYEATGEEEEQLDAILDQVDIETTVEDNQLKILFLKKDSDQNFWRWMKNEYKDSNYNLSVNLDITIPKSIKEFELTTNLGDLSLDAVEGAINAYTALGSVTAKNVLFIGDSKLETSLGDINCSFDKSTKDKSMVKLKTALGNVKIDTNGLSVEYTEEKKEEILTDSTELLVGGVSKLEADTALGKISVKE